MPSSRPAALAPCYPRCGRGHLLQPCLRVGEAVRLKYCVASSGGSMIVAEQSTEALPPYYWTRLAINVLPGYQSVIESLMIPLRMIVGQVLVDRIRQGAFPQQDHLLQRLLLDGAYKPFAVGVQVRTARRQEERFYPTVLEQCIERLREFRVPVVDQVAFPQQESIKWICQLSSTLLHEGGGGMRSDARNLHA